MMDLIINGIDFDRRLEEARWKLHRRIDLMGYIEELDIRPSEAWGEIIKLVDYTYDRIHELLDVD